MTGVRAITLDRPRGDGLLARAAWLAMRVAGWRVVTVDPLPRRCVVVFYPHTSNWDFAIGLLAKWVMDVEFHVMVKDTLFLPRWCAPWAIRVNRRERTGVTATLAARFADEEVLRLVLAPEGTRRRTEHWKSGFYHLARSAGVPLALSFIDYARRETGVGTCIALTRDAEADMRTMAAFYAGKIGRHPTQAGPVRLEDAHGPPGGGVTR
ncbi:MAG: glycerol acyltransferase [Burkholderiales bacterium]